METSDIEKRSFFALVAYGIHSKFQKKIKRSLEKDFGYKSFYIYEYFLEKPIVKGSKKENIPIFEPFLLRILNESLFIPRLPENILENFPKKWTDIGSLPNSYKNMISFWNAGSKGARITDLNKYTFIGTDIFDRWQNETEKSIVTDAFTYTIDYLRKRYLIEDKIQNANEVSRIGILKEYATVILPWLSCLEIEKLNIATFSLSSQNIFYGYILIYYPPLDNSPDIFINKNGEQSEASIELKKFINETYIPILALFENYWEEHQLKKEMDTGPDWNNYVFLNENLAKSADSIESGLFLLWQARKSLFENHSSASEAIDKINESLLFAKYLVASPVMINEIKRIIFPRNDPRQFKDKASLPCALIIGGPGSGKDLVSKIVHLFFPEYRFGEIHTINMASLKPNYLSVPLMSGFESQITGNILKDGNDSEMTIEATLRGIFAKIWKQHKEKYPSEGKMKEARKEGMMPIVILDELNSLDIDAQGSLLRILQNAELQPLGSTKKEKVDFLIVGVINEPEHTLTLEEPLRNFITDKDIFGGVLGRSLYEYFRSIRRLRDDLFYRLVRDGRFILRDLNDRREEIPILFSFFVKEELDSTIGEEIGWDDIWFDLDIFEELMDPAISWSGNFRQLQSLAKRTSYNILQKEKYKKAQEKIQNGDDISYIHISLDDIRDVMREFFDREI